MTQYTAAMIQRLYRYDSRCGLACETNTHLSWHSCFMLLHLHMVAGHDNILNFKAEDTWNWESQCPVNVQEFLQDKCLIRYACSCVLSAFLLPSMHRTQNCDKVSHQTSDILHRHKQLCSLNHKQFVLPHWIMTTDYVMTLPVYGSIFEGIIKSWQLII